MFCGIGGTITKATNQDPGTAIFLAWLSHASFNFTAGGVIGSFAMTLCHKPTLLDKVSWLFKPPCCCLVSPALYETDVSAGKGILEAEPEQAQGKQPQPWLPHQPVDVKVDALAKVPEATTAKDKSPENKKHHTRKCRRQPMRKKKSVTPQEAVTPKVRESCDKQEAPAVTTSSEVFLITDEQEAKMVEEFAAQDGAVQ